MSHQVFAAVKALIQDGEKFLVLRQQLPEGVFYDIPGGKVDFGESPYDTLKREVKEEVGLEVEIIKPAGMWWFFRKNDGNQVVCNTFLCKPLHTNIDTTNNPSETENIEEVIWISKEEFMAKTENESLKILLANLVI